MDSNQFKPPVRRSMTDAELQDALGNSQADEAGILKAMELLETQAQLRDIEKMEYASWLLRMEQLGTPEALLAIENANRAQQGLEPLDALPASQPAVEDVVANLNALFGAKTENVADVQEVSPAVEPLPAVESSPVVEPFQYVDAVTHESAVIEPIETPDTFAEFFTEIENEEAEQAPEPVSVAASEIEAFDMVIGAEEELTAIEEAFFEQQPAEVVIEEDPFVDFITQDEPVVEEVALESAPKLSRRSRAISQFWAWLGFTGSVLPIIYASFLNGFDLSFAQLSLAVVLGLLASGAVISIGTLAGKRSGLPTLMLSRAAFGVHGNYLPGAILVLTRLFWTTALIGVAIVLAFPQGIQVESIAGFSSGALVILGSVLALIIASVTLAIFGGRVLYRAQQVSGVVGLAVIVTWFISNASTFSAAKVSSHADGSWLTTFAVAILTFSIFGLVWSSASADYARKLHVSVLGLRVISWGLLALVVVPAAILLGALAILRSGTIASPQWLPVIILVGSAVSFVVWLGMSFYSSNLSLHSIGLKLRPIVSQPLLGLVLGAAAVFAVMHLQTAGFWFNLHGYALALAVPTAAWTGIFVSDILIRRIAYHEISLSRGYGFYKSVNWFNLIGWLLTTAVGFGLTYSNLTEFKFFGFIADRLVNQEFWRESSFGVVITFALGLLLPVALGIPRIKRQEAEVLNIEARRNDLKDVLGLVD
jgi:purine-cytosine permease-like protein